MRRKTGWRNRINLLNRSNRTVRSSQLKGHPLLKTERRKRERRKMMRRRRAARRVATAKMKN